MDLPQFLTLEDLLGFMGTQQAIQLARAIRDKDPSFVGQLAILESKAWEHYNDLFEAQGPQALSHLGWLQVGLGNYCLALQTHEMAHGFYIKAWSTFSNPEARGHDEKAHRLVQEVPGLLRHTDVSTFYQQNPEIAKTYGINVLLSK